MPFRTMAISLGVWLLAAPPVPASAGDAAPSRLQDNSETPQRITTDGLRTCFDFKDVRVTVDADLDIGESIYLSAPSSAACKLGVSLGRVVMDDGESSFIGKSGRYLLIDQGTGPEPRGLVLIDVATRTSVYANLYDNPLALDDGVLSYWRPTKIAVTKDNCAKRDEWAAAGFEPLIERHVQVDLKGPQLSRVESQELRCQPTQ